MDYCMMVYFGRPNDNMFRTSVKTLKKVSNALLKVYSDEPFDVKGVDEWVKVKPAQIKGRRMSCLMECLEDILGKLSENDRLMITDIDTYFLADPFTAFDKLDFDIGVTTRVNSWIQPVNAGVFFVRVNEKTKKIFISDFKKWAESLENKDWWVKQLYLCHLLKTGQAKDVGWEYNFCPSTDVFSIELASDMIRRAYESKSVKVLHLKSELCLEIYSGYLEDVVINGIDASWNWLKEGKYATTTPTPQV